MISLAIYDGRAHLGEVVQRSSNVFEALGPDGSKLGRFPNPEDARQAILAARPTRGTPTEVAR